MMLNNTYHIDRAAFFIGSPFQCLCALEAIHHFNINAYDFYIYDKLPGSDKLIRLLDAKGITYYPIIRKKHLILYLTLIFKRKHSYQYLFIGNMFDNVSYALSSIYSARKSHLIYLDDGIQALAYFGERSIKHPLDKNGFARVFEVIFKLKKLSDISLFTIYDVNSSLVKVIHNELSLFKTQSHLEKKNVYIIGTNSSALRYKNKSYLDYLAPLIEYLKLNYQGSSIYYCPHRRDNNNPEIFSFCSDRGVRVFDTQISVEYDFINNDINPLVVVGFASNALFVLNAIYPESSVNTVHYELEDSEASSVACVLEENLNKNGIKTITVL